jgi:catechol 2,3-dioxygenase-like lactoylglutathione lyase family enzyme
MLKIAHPIFGVTSSEKAEQFYCQKLGFRVKHVHAVLRDKLREGKTIEIVDAALK